MHAERGGSPADRSAGVRQDPPDRLDLDLLQRLGRDRPERRLGELADLLVEHRDLEDDIDDAIEPSGEISQEQPAKRRGTDVIGSVLHFGDERAVVAGRWTLELVLEDDVIDRQMVVIRPQPSRALQPL